METTEFHVLTLGDRSHPNKHPPSVGRLVSKNMLDYYLECPGACDNFPVLCCLSQGDQVCSRLRLIPDELTVDGRVYRWAWSGDNFTHADYRGRGYSTLLQASATDYLHALGVGRGSVFSTDVTLHIFRKLGFVLPGYAKRYLLLRSASPLLNARVRNEWLRLLCGGLSRPMMAIFAKGIGVWSRALCHGTSCERVTGTQQAEFELLLEQRSKTQTVHFGLDVNYITRKMRIAQKRGDVSAWLVRAGDGHPSAYLILRDRAQETPMAEKYHGFRLMTLMDFNLSSSDTHAAAAITSHAVNLFLESGCDILEIITSNPRVQNAALRRGMIPVGKGMSFGYSVPETWSWPSRLRDIQSWPLTVFCGDGFSL